MPRSVLNCSDGPEVCATPTVQSERQRGPRRDAALLLHDKQQSVGGGSALKSTVLGVARDGARLGAGADCTMQRVGSLGFSVRVSPTGLRSKDSKVRVRSTLERFGLPGMELAASSEPGRAPHVDPSRLPEGLSWSIDDRLRHAGARKGRVLAVWQGKTLLAHVRGICTRHAGVCISCIGCATVLLCGHVIHGYPRG